jgi:hypothetical protein
MITCDWCKKHLSELKPFEKPWPFEGEVLVRVWAPLMPGDIKTLRKWREFFPDRTMSPEEINHAREKIIERFGNERAGDIEFHAQASSQFGNTWLCSGCLSIYYSCWAEMQKLDERPLCV